MKCGFSRNSGPQGYMSNRRLKPTTLQHHCMKQILNLLAKAEVGHLQLTLPDGALLCFGGQKNSAPARMRVNNYRFFSRIALGSDIGLGESFMFDEWHTDDIAAVIGFFIRNRPALADGNFKESLPHQALERLRYLTRRNTLPGSRRNIRRHYDLSNDFFQTFLDDSMAYSSAIFQHTDESLETAQQNKYRQIIEKARIGAEDHVLEIGCGWGGFAIEAVRRCNCRVTGITLSIDQYQLARKRVREAGLQDRIDILFHDYRSIRGRFDKIVSIEMLEAVGHKYFGEFFKRLDSLLSPDGIAVIQVITIPDQRYDAYRRSHDWIRKHIFPGGLLPSLTILMRNMTRHSTLMVHHLENIGDHYALTLTEWRRRFMANRGQVDRLGFDRPFQRKWLYYLASCEAGFRQRVLGDLQLVLTRESNPALSSFQV